ncbi:MAG: DndE family protein [Bacteroidales bacterium]|nr:DndE family protein [Bacteroidales bacterium]
MFTHIKTSKKNKLIVTDLSRKLNLGTENIVARIAFAYSISKDRKFTVIEIKDSQGKEYSKNVLFGNNYPFYLALLCTHYGIHKTNRDIPKYFKIHIDDGLELLDQELKSNPNLNGFDFITEKIENGLAEINF